MTQFLSTKSQGLMETGEIGIWASGWVGLHVWRQLGIWVGGDARVEAAGHLGGWDCM